MENSEDRIRRNMSGTRTYDLRNTAKIAISGFMGYLKSKK